MELCLGPPAVDCIADDLTVAIEKSVFCSLCAVCSQLCCVVHKSRAKYIYEMHAPMDARERYRHEMEERRDKNLFIVEIAFTSCSEWKRSSDCIHAIVHTQKLHKHFAPSENSQDPRTSVPSVEIECTYIVV